MLLVKTRIGPSKINGIGLFAAEFVKKGTPTWKFTPGLDLELKKEDLVALSEYSREQILNYSYIDKEKPDIYILCFDDARFVNHSKEPNITNGSLENGIYSDIAAHDIPEGEELTFDYEAEDLDYHRKFGLPVPIKTPEA
ncbi:MAG: SET domain-containing protein [bacterium]|nr:SET domain-containing protein [bacterium]